MRCGSTRTPLPASRRGLLVLLLVGAATLAVSQPLHDAAAEGDLDRVTVLLERPGVDVNQANRDGWSPLQEAAARHYEDICKALVDAGANVDHQNNDGWTPLHEAAARGLMDTTRLLVEHGANLEIKNKDGDTPLHVAASHHMAEAVNYLLKKGADPNAMNNDARKPHSMTYGDIKNTLMEAKQKTDL